MAGYPSRGGLNARQGGHGDVTIQIDPGSKFDFDSEVDGLRAHVSKIKMMSRAIEEERKLQGEVINNLESAMDRASVAMKRTMRRLNVAYTQAQSWHLLVLVVFVFVLFTVVIVVAKMHRLGHTLLGRS